MVPVAFSCGEYPSSCAVARMRNTSRLFRRPSVDSTNTSSSKCPGNCDHHLRSMCHTPLQPGQEGTREKRNDRAYPTDLHRGRRGRRPVAYSLSCVLLRTFSYRDVRRTSKCLSVSSLLMSCIHRYSSLPSPPQRPLPPPLLVASGDNRRGFGGRAAALGLLHVESSRCRGGLGGEG